MKEIAKGADLVLVVGSGNSSNSVRLVEVALESGAKAAYRVDDASEIDESWLDGVESVGVTSGASVPEDLVDGVLDFLTERGYPAAKAVHTAEESLIFALPPELRRDMRQAGSRSRLADFDKLDHRALRLGQWSVVGDAGRDGEQSDAVAGDQGPRMGRQPGQEDLCPSRRRWRTWLVRQTAITAISHAEERAVRARRS